MTDTAWIAVATLIIALWFILAGRLLYEALRYTKEKRIALEAQRHMLRFCKNPTRSNWENAWSFITDNEVKLGELDWPLVERFTKTAVAINFPP
jgi:hypothetical protein